MVTYYILDRIHCTWIKVTTSITKWASLPHVALSTGCKVAAVLGSVLLTATPTPTAPETTEWTFANSEQNVPGTVVLVPAPLAPSSTTSQSRDSARGGGLASSGSSAMVGGNGGGLGSESLVSYGSIYRRAPSPAPSLSSGALSFVVLSLLALTLYKRRNVV